MPTSEEPAVTVGGPRRSPGVGLSKEKKSTLGKKLVQARLPFKRLNPVPKENVEGVSDVKKVKPSQHASSQNRLPKLDASIDSFENDCQANPEIVSPPPKTVNGKGPLDQFLKRRTDLPDPPAISIDLTEDSNSTHGCSTEVNALEEASNRTVQQVKIPLKPDLSNQNDHCEVPMETDEPSLNTLAFTNGDSKDQTSYSSNVLSDGKGLTMSQENQAVIFQGKKAVVVLEDIMITKPALLGSTEGSVVFKDSDEAMDSPVEVESASPTSSPSVDSSPVAGGSPLTGNSPVAATTQENKNSTSPSSLTTPRRKIPLKTSKPSSEKKRTEQEEKKKKLQAEKEERERLKEEAKNAKERAKEEAKRKKDEEKELKDKERKEKKDREEQEKKDKKEKEEKEKAEKLRLKEEKRKEKQDALEAKLEEKRKKEEEKKAKEEEKRIKAGKSEITRFFHKPKTQNSPKTFASSCGKFAPFEIKKNMALAPLCRVDFDQAASDKLDELLQSQILEVSYLKELQFRKPCISGRTVVHHHIVPANSDVIVVENGETDCVQEMPDDPLNSDLLEEDPSTMDSVPERKTFGRMKLLQFSENHRPAYWGTWNKASTVIHPRKPWLKDDKLLDYEVDSDEEWEEEEPGESLSHSEGDDDEEAGDDDEDDDGFFVPHGYLSDDEGAAEEERVDPENQKVRQKLKAKEWDELVSEGKKFRVLKPVLIGCIWESSEASREMKALQRFAACILESVIAEEELAQEKSEKRNLKDQQILKKLLPLLHGNFNGSKVIIHEFQECCRRGLLSEGSEPGNPESNSTSPISPNTSRPTTPTAGENALVPSKARLKRIISENSTYEKRPDVRMCWYVHAEVLKRFDQQALPVPCQWTYLTQVNAAAKEDSLNSLTTLTTQTTPVSVKRKSSGSMSITKFMKRPKEVKQVGVVETDGFQADTEDEDDDDCIVVDVQQNKDGITAAAKTAMMSVKTSPSSGSVVCVSNSTALEVFEHECAMEVVPSEAPTANMSRVMEAGITGHGMVSNNREVKTVPHGDGMLFIGSAMDTIPSNDTICNESGKTVLIGNAVLTMDTQLPCKSKTETDVGICLENTIPKASSAGGIVDLNSAMEPIPATSALISIPNQA